MLVSSIILFRLKAFLISSGIKVRTTDGMVTLSGVVDTYWEKGLAEDVALYTDGVIDVVNELTVTPVKSIIDIDIERRLSGCSS